MNIYTLDLIWENYKGYHWDYNRGFVIIAETAKEARKIANDSILVGLGNEQFWDLETDERDLDHKDINYKNNIWLKPKYTKIQKFGIASKGIKKGVVFIDFQYG